MSGINDRDYPYRSLRFTAAGQSQAVPSGKKWVLTNKITVNHITATDSVLSIAGHGAGSEYNQVISRIVGGIASDVYNDIAFMSVIAANVWTFIPLTVSGIELKAGSTIRCEALGANGYIDYMIHEVKEDFAIPPPLSTAKTPQRIDWWQ